MSDYVIQAQYIVTDASRRESGVITDGMLRVSDSLITDIGPSKRIMSTYPNATVIGSNSHIAIPGFVDAHNHGQGVTTLRLGIPDDLLEVWVHSWPTLESRSPELAFWDSLVAAARQIRC